MARVLYISRCFPRGHDGKQQTHKPINEVKENTLENMSLKKGFLKETILHFGSTSSEMVPRCTPAKIILYRSDFKQIFKCCVQHLQRSGSLLTLA